MDLLGQEFRGDAYARLSSFGVAAYDEEELAGAVLEQARTRAETGVATSASLATIEALLARARDALSSHNTQKPTDEQRLRAQLLQKLVTARKSAAAAAASAASAASGTASTGNVADVLGSLGRATSGAAVASSGTGVAETSAASATGPATAQAGPSAAPPRSLQVTSRSQPVVFAPAAIDGDLGNAETVRKKTTTARVPRTKVAAAPDTEQPQQRKLNAAVAPSSNASPVTPSTAPSCPICGRSLNKLTESAASTHVDRCLTRPRHSVVGALAGSSATTPAAAAEDGGVVSAAAVGPSIPSIGKSPDADAELFSKEPSDDEINEEEGEVVAVPPGHAPGKRGSGSSRSKARESDSNDDVDADDRQYGEQLDDDEDDSHVYDAAPATSKRGRISKADRDSFAVTDDYDDYAYEQRVAKFIRDMRAWRADTSGNRSTAVTDSSAADAGGGSGGASGKKRKRNQQQDEEDEELEALQMTGESASSFDFTRIPDPNALMWAGDIRVPSFIHAQLLPYQVEGLQWLWGLHRERVGGILGDEMGLGKTVQMAALLGTLKANNLLQPSMIICPATVIGHWVRELTTWWPALRVLVLHESGAAFRSGGSSSSSASPLAASASNQKRREVISTVLAKGDIVVTTYEALRLNADLLLRHSWGYAVLDEGHRIRNPTAAITQFAKQIKTVHRIILTGAPIQNRLRELWSLFDFVFPGRMGSLQMFEAQFAGPIAAGGWTHASQLQVQTAYQCALVLRDLIQPYLLRRLKRDVNAQLPSKTEQVLFCRLSPSQRETYARFLRSREVADVLAGAAQAFRAVTVLRKICNHPKLLDADDGEEARAAAAGLGGEEASAAQQQVLAASGKMVVLAEILRLWRTEKHRCLIFCQGTQMLDIVEQYVQSQGYRYLRMDGGTPVKHRQGLVDAFNTDASWFLFLLTTRVGGVGVNLIGADRVLIYDPDWNPSTDMQARERAWRLGQRRHVTIYRLITSGTIEEKIYHRQIFKTALTQRVLSDPKSKRLFNYKDLRELFTLTDASSASVPTETAVMIPEADIEVSRAQDSAAATAASAASSSSSSSSRHKRKDKGAGGASASTAAEETAALAARRAIVSAEAYEDPDAKGVHGDNDDEEYEAAGGSGGKQHKKKHRHAKTASGSDDDKGGESGDAPSQTAVLQALLDGGGVSSVFSHDIAEDHRSSSADGEGHRVLQHARKYAKQAFSALAPTIADKRTSGDTARDGAAADTQRASASASRRSKSESGTRSSRARADVLSRDGSLQCLGLWRNALTAQTGGSGAIISTPAGLGLQPVQVRRHWRNCVVMARAAFELGNVHSSSAASAAQPDVVAALLHLPQRVSGEGQELSAASVPAAAPAHAPGARALSVQAVAASSKPKVTVKLLPSSMRSSSAAPWRLPAWAVEATQQAAAAAAAQPLSGGAAAARNALAGEHTNSPFMGAMPSSTILERMRARAAADFGLAATAAASMNRQPARSSRW